MGRENRFGAVLWGILLGMAIASAGGGTLSAQEDPQTGGGPMLTGRSNLPIRVVVEEDSPDVTGELEGMSKELVAETESDLTSMPAGSNSIARAPAMVMPTGNSSAGPFDVSDDPYVAQMAAGAKKVAESGLPIGAIQTALILGVLSLAPAILLMTTSYVRIVIVLGLLRQALGAQQLPPTQVMGALSVFVTIIVMTPVWQEIRREAIDPCIKADSSEPVDWEQVCQRGTAPLKKFMLAQIAGTGNLDSLNVFNRYANRSGSASGSSSTGTLITRENIREVPFSVVLPAFLISELKVAFLIGFQIFLPFLVLDLVVSTLSVSMGMVMLPPSMVSLPLKLILFVMADGWNLVIGLLLNSFH